jgi:hypothetical protein
VNVTASPELAVALTLKSGSPNVLFARGANVIVWFALLTVSVVVASFAAAKLLSVAKLYVIAYGVALAGTVVVLNVDENVPSAAIAADCVTGGVVPSVIETLPVGMSAPLASLPVNVVVAVPKVIV